MVNSPQQGAQTSSSAPQKGVRSAQSVYKRNTNLHKKARDFFVHDRTCTVLCMTITRGKNIAKTTLLGTVPAAETLQTVQTAAARILQVLNDVAKDIEDTANPCQKDVMEIQFESGNTRKRKSSNQDPDDLEINNQIIEDEPGPAQGPDAAVGSGDAEEELDVPPAIALCRLLQEANRLLQAADTDKDAEKAEELWGKIDDLLTDKKAELSDVLLSQAERISSLLGKIWFQDDLDDEI